MVAAVGPFAAVQTLLERHGGLAQIGLLGADVRQNGTVSYPAHYAG